MGGRRNWPSPSPSSNTRQAEVTFGFAVGRHFAVERISSRYPAETDVPPIRTVPVDLVGLHLPPPRGRPVFLPYATVDSGPPCRPHVGLGLDA